MMENDGKCIGTCMKVSWTLTENMEHPENSGNMGVQSIHPELAQSTKGLKRKEHGGHVGFWIWALKSWISAERIVLLLIKKIQKDSKNGVDLANK